jgi:hypothetical protein
MTAPGRAPRSTCQGNGGASDEDRRSGFEHGGWAMGVFAEDTLAFITETYASRSDSNGVTIQVYRPLGRPQYRLANADWAASRRGARESWASQ